MTEADFGFDAVDWLDTGNDADEDQEEGAVRRELLPKLEITDAMGPEERLKIMHTRYPEFEPLAKEFLELQVVHQELTDIAKEGATVVEHDDPADFSTTKGHEHASPRGTIASLKYRALSAYLGSLSMYFAVLTSGAQSSGDRSCAMPPEELRDHTIMDTLVQCRDLWERTKDIPLPEPSLGTEEIISHQNQAEKDSADDTNGPQLGTNGHSDESPHPKSNEHISKHQKKRVRKAERLALAAQEEANDRRKERLRQAELSLQSLPDFTKMSARKVLRPTEPAAKGADDENDSDFGDATSLTAHEAAEKARRKRSLKFYTSQIAQKSSKRDGAGRDAGGDVDVPYRERLRDRQERLNAEAERRGKKPKASNVGAALGDNSPGEDEEDEPTNAERRQNGDASDSDNEYYDLIAKRASDKKASKAANNAAAGAAAVSGSVALDNIALDADGKRAITYAIEKNKGLHPHRKKDVRNPRVKKRKKFEEKKKKLGSVRAVYKKDREGKGGYGGEKTGIKRGLVRSVKL